MPESPLDNMENKADVNPLDISVQVGTLKELKDGWLDGEGIAPSHGGLCWLVWAFKKHWSDSLPLPYIYPTPAGGAQLEWSFDWRDISLDINLTRHTGQWFALDLDTGKTTEKNLNLDLNEDWAFIKKKSLDLNDVSLVVCF